MNSQEILTSLNNQDNIKPIEVINKEKDTHQGRIIAFIGLGATSTAFHIALTAAQDSTQNIGLLDMNLKAPHLVDFLLQNSNGGNLNIDNLVPTLAKGTFTTSELKSRLMVDKKMPNLWYLLGTNYPYLFNHYSGVYIDAILEAAKHVFDTILVDVCRYPDNPATISALANADVIVFITPPEISTLRSWRLWIDFLLADLNLEEKMLGVINYADASSVYGEKELSQERGFPFVAKIPTVKELTDARNECINLKENFSGRAVKQYRQEIEKLSDLLTGQNPFNKQNLQPAPKEKGWLLRKFNRT